MGTGLSPAQIVSNQNQLDARIRSKESAVRRALNITSASRSELTDVRKSILGKESEFIQTKREGRELGAQSKAYRDQINSQKAIITANQRYTKMLNITSTSMAFLSAVAISAGKMLEEMGRAALQEGTGGETSLIAGKMLASGGQAAAVGAMFGSMIHPVVGVIASLGGAAIGATMAFVNAKKEIENIKVMKSFRDSVGRTSRVLDSFAEDTATFDTANIELTNFVKETQQ